MLDGCGTQERKLERTVDPERQTGSNVLRPPAVQRVRYARNFIKVAVCEVRFPVVLELESKPPVKLQRNLRKDYPNYEPRNEFSLGATGTSAERHVYVLQSKKKDWTVQVKSDSLVLETSRYVDFDDFSSRLQTLLDASAELTDTDFYMRVGLRYINEIPLENGSPVGWINPKLHAVSSDGVLGQISHEMHEFTGVTEFGQYLFRHGGTANASGGIMNYLLDYDYWTENIEVRSVPGFLMDANETNFRFFSWCLGDKGRTWLGDAKPKD